MKCEEAIPCKFKSTDISNNFQVRQNFRNKKFTKLRVEALCRHIIKHLACKQHTLRFSLYLAQQSKFLNSDIHTDTKTKQLKNRNTETNH